MSENDIILLPSYPEGYRLESARLQLQPVTVDDANELWELMSDPRLSTFLAWDPHQSVEETYSLIRSLTDAHRSGIGFHWVAKHEGKIVGLISLIDVRRKHRCWTLNRAELAYWIGIPFQGHGFATEAAATIIKFGFSHLHLHKIIVYHAVSNQASARTIEKLGFHFVGEERDSFQKNNKWHNLSHFELLSSDQL